MTHIFQMGADDDEDDDDEDDDEDDAPVVEPGITPRATISSRSFA